MDLATNHPTIEMLLVEDNPGDVRLMREAFRETGARSRLHVVGDGVEAMKFLRGEDGYADAVRPDVILLDLNLPRMGGREVLAEVKSDPRLKHLPVVVLSSSSAEEDVAAAYGLHANCYVTKPADLDRYLAVARAIESFWFTTARLATRPAFA
jgi:two-component system, chemotaxis family, response regulator Rcp1